MEEEGGDQVEEDIDFWGEGSFWQNIPDDLMIHIFSFLDCNSLLEASKTCRVSKNIMQCRCETILRSTENVQFLCHHPTFGTVPVPNFVISLKVTLKEWRKTHTKKKWRCQIVC